VFRSIITHRGIDIPLGHTGKRQTKESSWEAFVTQLGAGFGLEFDIQPMKDGRFAVSHDLDLNRLLKSKSNMYLSDMTTYDLGLIKLPSGDRMCGLEELLELLVNNASSVSALHLKHNNQDIETLNNLMNYLGPYLDSLAENLILFDVKPEAASYLKHVLPPINLAASVSLEHDINRFGKVTGNTLLSPSEVIKYEKLYSWVWLDEWDLIGENNSLKSLINLETVSLFREYDFKIAAVSPELHARSTALLGKESHENGCDPEKLHQCWKEWCVFNLDALCTDHGSWLVNNLMDNTV